MNPLLFAGILAVTPTEPILAPPPISFTVKAPDVHPSLYIGFLGSATMDVLSTHLALQQGGREVVMSQSPIGNDLMLGALAAGTTIALTKLAPKHPRLTKMLLIAATAWRTSVAIRNVRAGKASR